MKYPTCTITKDGVSITVDIYDLAKALGIESHPLFNAWKKIIRRGNGAKSERQDLEEVKQSVDRYLRDLTDSSEPFWIPAVGEAYRQLSREGRLMGVFERTPAEKDAHFFDAVGNGYRFEPS